MWQGVLYCIQKMGVNYINILYSTTSCHILTCNCEQKLMMKTKPITKQLQNIKMIYKKIWFNNIAGMQFKNHQNQLCSGIGTFTECMLSCIHFYYVLFLNFRCGKFLFVTGDAPSNKTNEDMRCVIKCYHCYLFLFFQLTTK